MAVPPGDLRPTSERARQAYFNIIGERIDGARFLDLFAGSGIFSFEAVSRGAVSATAVDRERRSVMTIEREAEAFGVPVRAVTGDALVSMKHLRETFDLVYADPPYEYEHYDDLLAAIAAISLASDAIVAVEHRRNSEPFTAAGKLVRRRTAEYGEVWITFFTANAATELARR